MLLLVSNVRHFRGLSGFFPAVQKCRILSFKKKQHLPSKIGQIISRLSLYAVTASPKRLLSCQQGSNDRTHGRQHDCHLNILIG
jgi:hypothetical protein